jgi:hypothetical protein
LNIRRIGRLHSSQSDHEVNLVDGGRNEATSIERRVVTPKALMTIVHLRRQWPAEPPIAGLIAQGPCFGRSGQGTAR